MSYDLYMLGPVPGEEPMDTVERLEERPPRPPPIAPRRSATAASPTRCSRCTRRTWSRHEEPHSTELRDAEGIDVTLSDDHAWINFPYWESLDAARLTQAIERAAQVIATETGWELYDPQLERLIDPARDATELREMFEVGVGHVQRIGAAGEPAPPVGRRPSLWKRLRGGGP